MMRKLIIVAALFALIGSFAVAQELKVEYQYNVSNPSDQGNYFSFIGPIRYMSALKDKVDATSGASKLNSTENFNAYRYDVKGKLTLPEGLRGLFLYPCAPFEQAKADNLTVSKAPDGAITVNFAHRGTAYELVTDRTGKLAFPDYAGRRRTIGYIQGEAPAGSAPRLLRQREGGGGRLEKGLESGHRGRQGRRRGRQRQDRQHRPRRGGPGFDVLLAGEPAVHVRGERPQDRGRDELGQALNRIEMAAAGARLRRQLLFLPRAAQRPSSAAASRAIPSAMPFSP